MDDKIQRSNQALLDALKAQRDTQANSAASAVAQVAVLKETIIELEAKLDSIIVDNMSLKDGSGSVDAN